MEVAPGWCVRLREKSGRRSNWWSAMENVWKYNNKRMEGKESDLFGRREAKVDRID